MFQEQFQDVYVLVRVRKDDIIRQRHLRDGFLKVQGTSIFVIVNPNCPIRCDKVTNHLRVRGIQYRATSDSYMTSFVIFIMKFLSFMFTLALFTILNSHTQVVF